MTTTDDIAPRVGDIWSTLEILDIATQPDEVAEWLAETEISGETFCSGYPVFIETGVRHLLSLCRYNQDLNLGDDYITRRALAQLPPLSEIPHSSETLNLYRNCKQIQSDIRGCTSSDPKQLVSEITDVIEPLLKIRRQLDQDLSVVDVGVSPDKVRRDAVTLSLYTAFQQTRNNRPDGYGPSNLTSWLGGDLREGSIKGYAVTLQYLWSTLLEPTEYVEAGIPDLGHSDRYTTRDVWELEEDDIEQRDENPLSSYRTQVKETIVDPLDARYPEEITTLSLEAGDLFHWTGEPVKEYISPLTTEGVAPSLDDLEPAARVAYGLIWFRQAEWIGEESFSRLPLIETVLRGLTDTYRQFEEEVPIHVTRFNHPTEGGNLVSYAILQRVPPRSFGDPSGWLIFNNVAADFEVDGEHRIKRIESLLDRIPENQVVQTTVEVDRSDFIDSVAGRLSDDYVKQTRESSRMMNAIEAGRGVLVELLTAYVVAERYPDARVHWSDKQDGEEIDVWVEHSESIRVIECKVDLTTTGVHKIRQQLLRKMGRFGSERVVKGEVWTWESPPESDVESLESNGVTVNCVAESPELTNSDTDDLSILFSEFLAENSERHPLMPGPRFS